MSYNNLYYISFCIKIHEIAAKGKIRLEEIKYSERRNTMECGAMSHGDE